MQDFDRRSFREILELVLSRPGQPAHLLVSTAVSVGSDGAATLVTGAVMVSVSGTLSQPSVADVKAAVDLYQDFIFESLRYNVTVDLPQASTSSSSSSSTMVAVGPTTASTATTATRRAGTRTTTGIETSSTTSTPAMAKASSAAVAAGAGAGAGAVLLLVVALVVAVVLRGSRRPAVTPAPSNGPSKIATMSHNPLFQRQVTVPAPSDDSHYRTPLETHTYLVPLSHSLDRKSVV